MLVKLPLFINKREWLLFFSSIIVIFFINLSIDYYYFQDFKNSETIEVKVLAHYKKINKNNRRYYVLKCKNHSLAFYTTTWKKYDDLTNKFISLRVQNSKKISFLDYLKGFFLSTTELKVLDKEDTYYKIYKTLTSMHKYDEVNDFYSAIFMASNIDKETRKSIAILGISHLVAISGFHLSILAMFIYSVLFLPYKILQQKFFPYRNIKVDILIITLVILLLYLWFVDFVPSLLRSYVMLFIGSIFVIRYVKIFSFTTLLIAILLVIAFFPKMIFSVSFWFSASGVFYIYLFIHYFKNLNKILLTILFNFWIFMAMIPIAHFYFGIFSIYQVFSPILSMIFVIFYPLTLILHLVGFGDIFDIFLFVFLNIKDHYIELFTPLWFLVSYVGLSIISIFSKKVFIGLNFIMLSYLGYLIYLYFSN